MAKRRTEQQKMKLSYSVIFFMIALFFSFGIISKMVTTMFVERRYWQEVESYFTQWNIEIPAKRGDILSDEGLLLAGSIPQYTIHFDFKAVNPNDKAREREQMRKDTLFWRHLDEFVAQVHQLFPRYGVTELRNYYIKGYNAKSRYYTILPGSASISYNQYLKLREELWLSPKYSGWFYAKSEKISRQHPYGRLALRTLGDLYEAMDSAKNGLELSFDSLLRGVPGYGHNVKTRGVNSIVPDKEKIDGSDIVTTINVEIQDIVESALYRELSQLNATSGTAMVMEVKSGDIKAIANLNRLASGDFYETQNNAVKEIYEPGSTFKTLSMMIAMDDGYVTLDDKVFCHNGVYTGFSSSARMTDHNYRRGGYDTLTVTEVMKFSSNIGVAKLINEAYSKDPTKFVEGIRRVGMDRHFTMQLVGTAAPVVRDNGHWDATRLPWMSIGYNVQLPVVNTLTFYNAIANNGKMVAPRLVKEVRREGKKVQDYPVTVVRDKICKERTLRDIRYLLTQVVEGEDATGRQAGSDYFRVAGKTGTAQVGYGRGSRTTHMVSFCGYFPADAPLYSCIVSIRTSPEMQGLASGGGMAGVVFREVAEKIMANRNFRHVTEAVDSTHIATPRVLSGNLSKATVVLDNLGYKVKWDENSKSRRSDTIWGSATSDTLYVALHKRDYIKEGIVPNVVGMGAQDALYLLESVGLRVRIEGVGAVRSQSIAAGSPSAEGATIVLKLRM